jgi:hypothetical protein
MPHPKTAAGNIERIYFSNYKNTSSEIGSALGTIVGMSGTSKQINPKDLSKL